jgi:hypothetical protein
VEKIQNTKHNLLFDILRDYLQKCIDDKNEKLFQNFLTFLKAVVKPAHTKGEFKSSKNEMFIDGTEFYTKIISEYLNTVEYHSLYVFEVSHLFV